MWWHVTISGRDRATLLAGGRVLDGTRALVRAAGPRLLLFALADDHAHLVLEGDRAEVGAVAGGASRALGAVGAMGRERARVREVEGRRHLESLVRYLVRQPSHHGLPGHAALWPGSCFMDLFAARRLPGFDESRIAAALPRVAIQPLVCDEVGIQFEDVLQPPSVDELRALGTVGLSRVALAACGGVSAKEPGAQASRTAYVALVRRAGLHWTDGARAAGLSKPAWFRHASAAPDPKWTSALLRRIAIERAIAAAGQSVVSIRAAS